MFIKTLSVTALNTYIKKIVDSDFILNNTNVSGEISNFKLHSSGHIYFTLKDENSKISCVMFKSYAELITFLPREGMKVVVKGKVSIYPKDGTYQVYCTDIKPEGEGSLYVAFQNLKEKLSKEGLFEDRYKKTIPKYPRVVGVVTSPTGAAIRDIINVARRRNDKVDILIYPSLVQGLNASEDIIKGIKYLNSKEEVDVIIIARGGGSIEELWAFNDEALAYEIFNSEKPIISGVGHETDFTIADFVSDLRAPTPSAAAEIAVPSFIELSNKVNGLTSKLNNIAVFNLKQKFNRVDLANNRLKANSPMNYLINQYNQIDKLSNMLTLKYKSNITMEKQKLIKANALLSAHNPLNVLNKGYSIVQDIKGSVVSDMSSLSSLDEASITVKDGTVRFKLERT